MWLRPAALAVLTAALCLPAPAQPRPAAPAAPTPAVAAAARAGSVFTLDDALARIGEAHPDLRLFGGQRAVLQAERDQAAQAPPWMLGVGVDNVLGSGAVAGVKAAEVTLSLASVFERGGKLDARRTLAQSRIDALAVERESRRLDLLAEAARRYLAIVAAQRGIELAGFDIGQRQRSVAAARQRLQAGASPESGLLTAQAALARAELDRRRSEQSLLSARQHLAALWGERDPGFAAAAGDLYALPAIQDATALAGLLDRTPELARFADQTRIAEARLRLARSEAVPDLSWQVGVRRLQDGSDFGLIGSVSLPLGARSRAEPGIRGAQAELALLETEREAKGLSLYSTLVEAHGRYRLGALEVARLEEEVLPRLTRAEAAAEYAYRAGAIGYLELALLQAESVAVRRQRLDAAVAAQLALIEIQRLTGEGFLAASSSDPAGAAR
ncbi:TolC family protein [Lysobacter firmicutimachus]|uniref:TolC family protein n=1 Tax=Lysobacter firmicutimachus TaxID=1792846 RepID=A0AAU8MZM5_9GAMM|nr:TolC family protein [Lysobacter antibioticus]